MTIIRVIPCLDVSGGRVVKGVNFANLKDAGDPAQLAARYSDAGADELAMLDISASIEDRSTTRDTVERVAGQISVPLTVGGGVRSVEDVEDLLARGVAKVSVNTAAIVRPQLIDQVAAKFGPEVLVLSLDARRPVNDQAYPYEVTTHGGKRSAGLDALAWAREAQDRGVGEILLNSMDADGVQTGFDMEMLGAVRDAVDIPLIASGGAGTAEHFVDAARAGADAILAASVFHFGTVSVAQAKDALAAAGFQVRPVGS